MIRRYVTVDVFTTEAFGGNPLAVVLDAAALTGSQMQSIAAEFNYAETTFVLPPKDPAHTAWVRIFTPRSEMPFAGHPNVGTAFVLARELESRGSPPGERFVFEEGAGLVPVRLLRVAGQVVGAEFSAPRLVEAGPAVTAADAAACLSLGPDAIATVAHEPRILSVGLPFLVIEVKSRALLRAARPSLGDHERVLPPLGTDGVYAYVRGPGPQELHARMFAPIDGITEDPATGSATAATLGWLASLAGSEPGERSWRVEQGTDMGRRSLLEGRTERVAEGVRVHLGGRVVPMMRGSFDLL